MSFNLRHSASFINMLAGPIQSRHLIYQMTKREVIGRYRGSIFGLAWSFFNPLIMLAVYTIVFSVVFNARWSAGSDSKSEFALALFVGLIIHNVIAESLIKSPSLLIENMSYVKKVVFPIETLSWVVIGGTLFHSLISLGVWTVFYLYVHQTIQWTIIFLPLIFIPLILFSMGISWMLASAGVYIKDIKQMTSVFATFLLFMSPIFYPASRLPESFQTIIYLNPLTFIIEQARDVLLWGNLPNWTGLIISFVVSLLVAWSGFYFFQLTRKWFADYI